MPLALIVDSLDAVPEALKGEYAEKDGKFHLNVDGLEEHPSTAALRAAIKKERDDNKPVKDAIAAWKKIGKTPEEISELVAAKDAAEAEVAKKAGNFDVILGQHKTAAAKREAELIAERDNALGFGKSAIVETAVMGALTKAKVTPTGVALLTDRLGKRVSLDITNGKRTVQIMQADGETPMAGSGPDGAATFDDLVKETVKQFPELFEGTGAGGGGTPPKGGGGSGAKTMAQAEFNKLSPKDRASKMAEPGFKITA